MKLHLNPKGFTLFEKDRNLHNIQFDERKGERKKKIIIIIKGKRRGREKLLTSPVDPEQD